MSLTYLYINLLFHLYHSFILFSSPEYVLTLSLLFVLSFYSQDVSTYLYVNLLFFSSSSSMIFCYFGSPDLLSTMHHFCNFFLSQKCSHLSRLFKLLLCYPILFFPNAWFFSRVHATLQPALSVSRSVGQSGGWSVTFYFFLWFYFFYLTAPAQMV